jgi:hypothetical protein
MRIVDPSNGEATTKVESAREITWAEIHGARITVAGRASDADDCRVLLDALGLLPSQLSEGVS